MGGMSESLPYLLTSNGQPFSVFRACAWSVDFPSCPFRFKSVVQAGEMLRFIGSFDTKLQHDDDDDNDDDVVMNIVPEPRRAEIRGRLRSPSAY